MANRSIPCAAVRFLFLVATISPLPAPAVQEQRIDGREDRSPATILAAQATAKAGVVVEENEIPSPSGVVLARIAELEEALGPEHPPVAVSLTQRARLHRHHGEFAAACAHDPGKSTKSRSFGCGRLPR